MTLTAPYRQHNYLGEHVSDGDCLTFIQAAKWDSNGDGTGDPQNGMWFYQTTDHKLRLYKNGSWADMDTTGGSGGFPPWSNYITVDKTDSDADYSTIAAAISAASAGDTIIIGPGDYAEQLDITKSLRLVGSGRPVKDYGDGTSGRTRIRPTLSTDSLDALELYAGCTELVLENLEISPIITNSTVGGQNNAILSGLGCKMRIQDCRLAPEPASGAADDLSIRALVLASSSEDFCELINCELLVHDPTNICSAGTRVALRIATNGKVIIGGGTRIINDSACNGKGKININNSSVDVELNDCVVENEVYIQAANSVKVSGGARIGTYQDNANVITNTSEAGALRETLGPTVLHIGDWKDSQVLTRDGSAARGTYVDGTTLKRSVRMATDAALPACTAAGCGVGKTLTADANGALSVDGVAAAGGDRILVKNQATGSDNGIYDVTQAGHAGAPFILTRSEDCDGSPPGEVGPGGVQNVQEGTVNAETTWILATNGAITIDTTSLNYVRANLRNIKTATFNAEFDNGSSGTADTVDWNNGLKQKSTLTDDCTFTFTDPPGPCNMILKLIQDGTGGRTVTWPASVKWPGGTAPTLSAGGSDVDIVALYFDGTSYFGVASLDFS